MKAIEQWDALKLMATERQLDVDERSPYYIRIGSRVYYHYVSASIALLSAFDKIGTHVPPKLKARPDDMD